MNTFVAATCYWNRLWPNSATRSKGDFSAADTKCASLVLGAELLPHRLCLRFIFIALLNVSYSFFWFMFDFRGLTLLPVGVLLTFLWMLLEISPSPPRSITCASPIRTLFKSVPSRLTRHLLISVSPCAAPLAALKPRCCRVPLAGFFFHLGNNRVFPSNDTLASFFSSLHCIGDLSLLG